MTVTIADDKDKYLSYPIPNDELIKQLKLIRHIEGGERRMTEVADRLTHQWRCVRVQRIFRGD